MVRAAGGESGGRRLMWYRLIRCCLIRCSLIRCCLAWCLAVGASVAVSAAAGPPPAPTSGLPAAGPAAVAADSLEVDPLTADLLETLAEFEAADQPLAQRDLPAAATPGTRRAGPTNVRARWRTSVLATGVRHDGRFAWEGPRLTGRTVWRLRPDRDATLTGGLQVRLGRCLVGGGHLTMRHGFGLLAADPARRASLGADRALGSQSGGLVVRTASVPESGTAQAGAVVEAGRWSLAGLRDAAAGGGELPAPGLARRSWGMGSDGSGG